MLNILHGCRRRLGVGWALGRARSDSGMALLVADELLSRSNRAADQWAM